MAISPFIIEANKYEPKMRSALIKAFNELRTQESRAAIVRAIQEGGIDGVMRLFENIEPKIAAQLSPVIDQALGAGAALPATMIPAGAFLNKDVTISLYNQATVAYLERYKLDLIQQIGRNTREAVRTSLIADQIAGVNPVETARNFRNTLGLTERQEQSVRNYKGYLENLDKQALQRELRDKRHDSVISRAISDQKPLSPEQIEKMTNRYREKYIKYRAETIARTEALRAVSIGNRAALDQMIGNADVDTEKLRRFWHYTGDSRTRQAHRDIPGMNPDGRRLDEPFQTPLGPLMFPRDPAGSAENTIKCRCVEFYRLVLADGKLKGPAPTDEKPKVSVEQSTVMPEVKPKEEVKLSDVMNKIGGQETFDLNKIREFTKVSTTAESRFILDNIDSFTNYQSEQLLEGISYFGSNESIRKAAAEKYVLSPMVAQRTAKDFKKLVSPMLYGDDIAAARKGFAAIWQGSSLGSTIAPSVISALDQLGVKGASGVVSAIISPERVSGVLKNTLKGIYEETQAYYKKNGIKKVSLMRGVHGNVSQGQINKIESWTTSEKVAKKFAGKTGTIITKEVPVEELLYSYESHPVLLSRLKREEEFVVLYNKLND